MPNGYYASSIMTTVGYNNYYTCNYGYSTTGPSGAWPYAYCSLTGGVYVWNVVYSCVCALLSEHTERVNKLIFA